MSKAPSDATQLRTMRRELKRTHDELIFSKRMVLEARGRASRAEGELADWKRRFDLLLARTPKELS